MLKIVFKSSRSAFFELNNDSPYYEGGEYDVFLNGELALMGVRENCFSLFSLTPDTEYEVSANGNTIRFTTESESACLSVRDFGAIGDGVTDDSEAIRAAIKNCPENGRVYFPEGVYLSEPIRLKSDITLEIPRGATLLGFTDISRYPILPAYIQKDGEKKLYSSFEGEAVACYSSFISAYFEKNIKIIGEGIIDASADRSVWWTPEYVKNRDVRRPRLFFVNRCEGVMVHGITGRNSPSWNFHPFFSKNLGFYGIKVEARGDSPNTDGLNPECCNGVEIIGCKFSVGDDCIAIKSGKIDIGREYKTPSENITVRNCLMELGHGGVVLGSEISGGIKSLSVTKCIFSGTERGLRIKTRRGRGELCVVDGIEFENIVMENVGTPFVVNMHYNCDIDGNSDYVQTREALPIDERTPRVGRLSFKNITSLGALAAAAYFEGLAERPIDEITFENVSVSFAEDAKGGLVDGFLPKTYLCRAGLIFKNVSKVCLRDVKIEKQLGDRIILENTEEITEE